MSKSFFKRIHKEIQLYQKDNFISPNLILKPSNDFTIWYFIIYNLKDTDFNHGFYLCKIVLPPNYPFGPPDFYFLTESGRFKINTKLCTTFSSYHKEQYSPIWNLLTMSYGLVSFMTDQTTKLESHGIGGIYNTSKEDLQKIASDSIDNIKNNTIFKEYFSEYHDLLFN